MNLRYKTFLKANTSCNQELFPEYHVLRNKVMQEVRNAKTKYYIDLFNKIKSCKSYWKLFKNATNKVSIKPILGIKDEDRKIITSDQDKVEIINKHFSTIGEKTGSQTTYSRPSNFHQYTQPS
jgi:hypothetical protein